VSGERLRLRPDGVDRARDRRGATRANGDRLPRSAYRARLTALDPIGETDPIARSFAPGR